MLNNYWFYQYGEEHHWIDPSGRGKYRRLRRDVSYDTIEEEQQFFINIPFLSFQV